jgi:hypothetical protein
MLLLAGSGCDIDKGICHAIVKRDFNVKTGTRLELRSLQMSGGVQNISGCQRMVSEGQL